MNITVKYGVSELIRGLRDGDCELPDGSTVGELIEKSASDSGTELSESVKNSIVFLVNGKPAKWETVLSEGDSVRVLYKIIGG